MRQQGQGTLDALTAALIGCPLGVLSSYDPGYTHDKP
jgi:hypothetical protein